MNFPACARRAIASPEPISPTSAALVSLLSLTPLWAQADWMPARVLSPRAATMAYDPDRDRMVLFGGQSESGRYGDTWQWDGSTWTAASSSVSPGADRVPLAWFPDLRRVLALDSQGTTWLFGGRDWQRLEGLGPVGATMVLDTARSRIVALDATDQTWEYDGLQWTRLTPATTPGARSGAMLAFDSARSRTVLFGGWFSASLDDTWEWDGVNWRQINVGLRPRGRADGMMTYDPQRRRVVLFGGGNDLRDTWEFDGTAWTQRTPSTQPFARSRAAFAWDTARSRALLFGGSSAGVDLADTWQWDGTNWRLLHEAAPTLRAGQAVLAEHAASNSVVLFGGAGASAPLDFRETWRLDGLGWTRLIRSGPLPRVAAAAASAPAGNLVLFGGQSLGGRLADTWTFDGASWRAGPAGPAARDAHAMAFDATRGRTVLFGGADAAGVRSDTWEWDGTAWTNRSPAVAPPARSAHAMAYDPQRGRVVLFGGRTSAGAALGDLWEWDGSAWLQRNPVVRPTARYAHGLAYSAERRAVVLAGGVPLGPVADTWEWDGTNWREVLTASAPTTHGALALAYDAARGRVVGLGADVWQYGNLVPALSTGFGASCVRLAMELGSDAPHLGNARFRLEVTGAAVNAVGLIALSPNRQNVSLGFGCMLYVADPIVPVPIATGAAGHAAASLPIPAAAVLRGLVLNGQAACVDALTPLGVSLSPGLRLRVGD